MTFDNMTDPDVSQKALELKRQLKAKFPDMCLLDHSHFAGRYREQQFVGLLEEHAKIRNTFNKLYGYDVSLEDLLIAEVDNGMTGLKIVDASTSTIDGIGPICYGYLETDAEIVAIRSQGAGYAHYYFVKGETICL